MFGIFLSVLSMLLYLAESGIQLHLAIKSFDSNLLASAMYLAYIIGSLFVVNVASAVLVLRNMDFSGKRCGRFLCILLHIFQLGLIWRCLKLLMLYDASDWREFLALRLIHTGLQTLPFIVTNGFLTIKTFSFPAEDLANLFLMLLSSAIALSTFNLGKDLFHSDEFTEFGSRFRKPCGICLLILGSLFLLLSRCGSIALMLAILNYWVAIPLGIHFVIYWTVSSIYIFCSDDCSVSKFLRNFVFSYLNIFDIVEPELTSIHCRNVLYYSGVLVENLVMTALWMYLAEGDYLFKLSAVVMVLVSFVLGIIVKSSSCGCIHLDTDEPISIETLDLAAYITKQPIEGSQSPRSKSRRGSKDSKTRRSRDHNESSSSHNEINVDTIHFHAYENEAFQNNNSNPNTPKLRGKRLRNKNKNSKKAKDSIDGKENVKIKSQSNGSTGDVASSNSRNTNTLNISNQSNQQSAEPKTDNEALEEFNQQVISGFSTLPRSKKKRPDLGVRNTEPTPTPSKSAKKNTGKIGLSPGLSKKNSIKKAAIPLFPNECKNDIIGSKEFGSPKARHVLSNSVKDYCLNGTFDTETSYSEYVSYSYYDDSTDWCSTSYDSDFAMTWPQSNTVSIVNLHCLPKDKFSNTESVQLWLSKLEAWEPVHEYSDLPNVSTNSDSNDQTSKSMPEVDSIPSENLSHINAYHQQPRYIHHYVHSSREVSPLQDRDLHSNSFYRSSDASENGRTSKLSSPTDHFMKVGSSNIKRNANGANLSHKVTDNQTIAESSNIGYDKTIVLWRTEEHEPQDLVQESMV